VSRSGSRGMHSTKLAHRPAQHHSTGVNIRQRPAHPAAALVKVANLDLQRTRLCYDQSLAQMTTTRENDTPMTSRRVI